MKAKPARWFTAVIIIAVLLLLIFSSETPIWLNPYNLKGVNILDKSLLNEMVFIDIFKYFKFSNDSNLAGWKNKIFKGRTRYWIDEEGGEKFLHSKSEKTASVLYRFTLYDVNAYPMLSWKWRPVKFPDKKEVHDLKNRDDYALRLEVIFASGFFTNFRCIEYLWDESLEEGKRQTSPYSNKIMQLVTRQGQGTGEWVTEERNVLADYISLFGEKPKMKVRALAIMSDSEGTQSSCEGDFKEIKIYNKL